MENTNKVLQIKGLSIDFMVDKQRVNVIDKITIDLHKKETVGIVGESGCGKSISALATMGLLPQNAIVSTGEILYHNDDLLKYSSRQLQDVRGDKIAMIFQEPMTSLNPLFRVGDQIAEMILLHKKVSKSEANAKAIELLNIVAIPDPGITAQSYPFQLSGGMRQRVMIAMAMACEPEVLIADEPTTALDVTIQAQILDLMRELKDKFDSSIIFITHDLGVVAEMCDTVVVMYAGRVVEKAPVRRLFHNPTHPYTKGLLKSLPKLDEHQKRLDIIEGTVPVPQDFAIGCRMSDRCAYACEKCNEVPELRQVAENHFVACWCLDEVMKDK